MSRPVVSQTCLMLGSGSRDEPHRKILGPNSAPDERTRWVTLDLLPSLHPDVVFDLEQIDRGHSLPFEDNTFDEVHAYEVLEHFGRQGDFRGFFNTFNAIWHVLKPNGLLCGSCPAQGIWLWGDPGHTRSISHQSLSFLTKGHYDQLGTTSSSDYRSFIDPCWWTIMYYESNETFTFALRAEK